MAKYRRRLLQPRVTTQARDGYGRFAVLGVAGGADGEIGGIELEPHDLSLPSPGVVTETETAGEAAHERKAAPAGRLHRHARVGSVQDLAECLGRGGAVVHLDPDAPFEAQRDGELRVRVPHDIADELAREEHRDGWFQVPLGELGEHEPPRGSDAPRLSAQCDGFHASPQLERDRESAQNPDCRNGGCPAAEQGNQGCMADNDTEALEALDDVVTALEATCTESQVAADEAKIMRERSRAGAPLHESFNGDGGPTLIVRLSALQQRLNEAGSRLRRAQARLLQREGLSTERIAELFGVTRQRVSALLRPNDPR
jgi:hypothetical protein